MSKLRIPLWVWFYLLRTLRKRGGGYKESGAFLLAKNGTNKVTSFIAYDDLDPRCLDEGIVIFQGHGFIFLWNHCEENSLHVIADVHTHGGIPARQSESDRTNPMISRKGHIALILPNFARNHFLVRTGIGIYEYLGNHLWRQWNHASGRVAWTIF